MSERAEGHDEQRDGAENREPAPPAPEARVEQRRPDRAKKNRKMRGREKELEEFRREKKRGAALSLRSIDGAEISLACA